MEKQCILMFSGSNITLFTPILQTTQSGIVVLITLWNLGTKLNRLSSVTVNVCIQCLQEKQVFAINIYLKE